MVELVVIGASLGGLRAFAVLLTSLAPDFAVPIVLVQHRPPTGDRTLLLRAMRETSVLPICEIDDKQPLLAPCVYLAPAGYHTLIEPGHAALSVDAPVLFARPSIDVLFESAADAYGASVAAVLLTGASADGAAGMRHIHAAGGITIVEDPASAECAVMPAAALAATPVDYVAQLAAIPAILTQLIASQKDAAHGA